jgi:hypothetical protein
MVEIEFVVFIAFVGFVAFIGFTMLGSWDARRLGCCLPLKVYSL